MKVSKEDLASAAAQVGLSEDQREALWSALERQTAHRPTFSFATVAYYFGALIVISAMGWFMTLGWESFGGLGIFAIAAGYALAFAFAGRYLWFEKQMRVPGGLLITIAVCMTPLMVYGLEQATGLWPQGEPGSFRSYHIWVKGSWLAMELATIAAALVALRWFKFPFLTAPIAFTLWYMSMDLTPLLFGKDEFSWDERKWVSVCFGFAVLIAAWIVDRVVREDFAFWLYLFGLLAFCGGLSTMESGSELGKLIYCFVHLGLMGLGVLLRRRAFVVFGGLGVFGYLGYLSYRVFENSSLFPFALSAFGIAVIVAGLQFQKHQAAIEAAMTKMVPAGLRALLPPNREH